MRGRVTCMVLLAGAGVALAVLGALAANAATSDARWPGVLDLLRRNSWESVAGTALLAVLVAAAVAVRQEQPAAVAGDPPPPEPPPVADWVVDRGQGDDVVAAVCGSGGAVGITTSLSGAGGFGKTTLAGVVCADPQVRRRFRGRVYTVTIGRDVRGRAAIAAKVAEATRFITGNTEEFDDPALAGAHLGRLLNQRPRTLLVLDDVWESEQLAPFLRGGKRCVRLVTTRIPSLLPPDARSIPVDEMSPDQARAVLTWQLPPLPDDITEALLRATGRWALLLRLANRLIAEQVATGADVTTTATDMLRELSAHGPAVVDRTPGVLDLDDPERRNRAVRATVEAATTLLPPGGADRFAELAVFAEDEAVPLSLVAQLWRMTGGLTESRSRALCADLERLSLLSLSAESEGRITLHDVIRDYLAGELGEAALATVHARLVDAVADGLPAAEPLAASAPDPGRAWWELREGYLLDHLIEHLLAAGPAEFAEAVASDLRWVETRLAQRGPTAPWSDLTRIGSPTAAARAHTIAQAAHLLTPTDPARALTSVLHSRLEGLPLWADQLAARLQPPPPGPVLVNAWPPPDLPVPALLRTLTGFTGQVTQLAIAPNGAWIATVEGTTEVRIWDPATGTCTATLTRARGRRSPVESIAIAPDSTWIATSNGTDKVRIWNPVDGTLTGKIVTPDIDDSQQSVRSVVISPDGGQVAVTSDKRTSIWNPAGGPATSTFTTGSTRGVWQGMRATDGTWLAYTSYGRKVRIACEDEPVCTAVLDDPAGLVESVAVAPNGAWIAIASDNGTLRLWNRRTKTFTATLTGHTGTIRSVTISANSTWIATAGDDGTARIWNPVSGTCTAVLTGHSGPVRSVAISPSGAWVATASDDLTVRMWDRSTGSCGAVLTGHAGRVESVTFAADGTWLATTSDDRTVRIWNRSGGGPPVAPNDPVRHLELVAVSADGGRIATRGEERALRIWDRASGTSTTIPAGETDGEEPVAIAPDGTWLATTGDEGTLRMWDRASGTSTGTFAGHAGSVRSVTVSPDGTWLATADGQGMLRIWDRASGTCTRTVPAYGAGSVTVASDGSWLATVGQDMTVRVWDRTSGACTSVLTAHTDGATSVSVAPDGAWLATTDAQGTLRIWDRATERVATLMRVDGPLHSCLWASDSRVVAAAGERGLYLFALRR
ncbi:NB-ARC domain-containing protein [Streptomyces sp. NPDC057137]|uniref:NB-ARC domain-containing protein n=1 Tax=Streptomyces sp. NPDC057137 TaxID=3346030 RepID=UPI00362F71F4